MSFDPDELRRSAARLLEISERSRALTHSTVLDLQRAVDLNSPAMSLLRDVERRERLVENLLPKIAEIKTALTHPSVDHPLKVAVNLNKLAAPQIDFAKMAIAPSVIEGALVALGRWPKLQLDFHSFADRYADIAVKLGSLSAFDQGVVHTTSFLGRDIRIKSGLASLLDEPTEASEPIDAGSDAEGVLAAMRVRLVTRDPSYGQMFDETYDALRGEQRGRGRMVFLMLREIAKELLNDLAPTKRVQAFTADPDDFTSDGRPKHKAQIAYICRSLSGVGLSEYISSGRGLTRRLFNQTNRIVHARSYSLEEEQIRLMVMEADELVKLLLEISETGETKH